MIVKYGDHISAIYQNKEQQFSQLIPFITDGLRNNDKCVYIVDENSVEEVISEFKKAGFELGPFLETKQLEIFNSAEMYLPNGRFDPDTMIKSIGEIEKKALEEGYSGLRGAGEMTWVLSDMSNNKKLINYEVQLNNIPKNVKSILLCQYNENKFSHDILNNIIRSHPRLYVYGNFYENKYLYSDPIYFNESREEIPVDSYQSVIDIITGR